MDRGSSVELLITNLVNDVRPVTTISKWHDMALRWVIYASISVYPILYLAGHWRGEISSFIFRPDFILETSLLFISTVFSLFLALRLGTPGAVQYALGTLVVAFISIISWVGIIFFRSYFGDNSGYEMDFAIGLNCSKFTIILSALPSLILLYMLRRSATTTPRFTTLSVVLAGFLFGVLLMQFICPLDKGAHTLLSHASPVLAFSVISYILGRKILKW